MRSMQNIEASVSEFIDAMEQLIHHIGISCSNVLHTDGRNGLAYDVPIRLCMLYLSVLHEIKKILNDTEYQYQFFLSPLAYSRPTTDVFDFGLEPEDRLIRVRIARHQLYSPRALCAILAHEGSHYIGESRLREDRAHSYINIASVILMEMLLPDEMIGELIRKNQVEEDEQGILLDDWNDRKTKIVKYFRDQIYRGLQQRNKNRKHKYHFTDLYYDICDIITTTLMYDQYNQLLGYMNTLGSGVRMQLNFAPDSSKLLQVIEEEQKNFQANILKVAFESDLANMLDMVKGVLKEVYADLGAILLLKIEPMDYLESYLLSESYVPDTEPIKNTLLNRVALVKEIVSENTGWKKKWEEITEDAWENHTFLWELKKETDAYLKRYNENTLDQQNNNSGDVYTGNERFDPFLIRNIIEYEKKYLLNAYKSLKENIERPEVKNSRDKLRAMYKHFKVYDKGKEPGYKDFFRDFQNITNDYKNCVKSEWEQWEQEQV